jgi:hypothetical protein
MKRSVSGERALRGARLDVGTVEELVESGVLSSSTAEGIRKRPGRKEFDIELAHVAVDAPVLHQYEAEAPPSRSAGLPMLNRKHKRVGRGGSRHSLTQLFYLLLTTVSRPYLFHGAAQISRRMPRWAHVPARRGASKPSPDAGAVARTPAIKAGVSQTARISSRRRRKTLSVRYSGWMTRLQ